MRDPTWFREFEREYNEREDRIAELKENTGFLDSKINPIKKEWVSLTDDELTEMRSKVQKYTPMDSVEYGLAIQCAMEEKLKEKNGMD